MRRAISSNHSIYWFDIMRDTGDRMAAPCFCLYINPLYVKLVTFRQKLGSSRIFMIHEHPAKSTPSELNTNSPKKCLKYNTYYKRYSCNSGRKDTHTAYEVSQHMQNNSSCKNIQIYVQYKIDIRVINIIIRNVYLMDGNHIFWYIHLTSFFFFIA